MKRQGLVAAGLIGSAATVCVLLNQHLHLGAAEDGKKSFREALKGAPEPELVEKEDGIRLNYFDASWDRVLKNLAEGSDLTLVMEKTPPGRFARRDRTRYDLNSAVRILNSELEPLGYRLLHQNGFLIVLNLDQARTEYARPRLNADSSQPRSPVTRQFVRNNASGHEAAEEEAAEFTAEEQSAPASPRSSATKSTSPKTRSRVPSVVPASAEETPARGNRSSTPARSSRIRPVSATRQETAAETAAAETAVAQAADDSPLKTEEIPLQQGSASDVARTLYVVFRNRAELEKPGLGGFPGYIVRSNPVEGSSDSEPVVLFRVGIDQDSNTLLIEAPQKRLPHLRKLVTDLDRPAEEDADSAVKLLPNNGIPAQTARQLNDRIHQLVTMADEARAQEPAGSQPPAEEPSATEGGPAVNLRGEVNVQAMQDLGLLILKGNAADVERVEQIIQQLEKVSVGSLPGIHVLTLQNVDSEAMATLLTSVYEELSEQRQRTGSENRQAAAFIPVVQPNALLIISSEIERETILELAEELDKPLSPDLEFEVFPLKSAIASQVVTSLTEFYADRPGLGTSLRTFADVRTNSVVVQARPNELAEVRKLIDRIDIDDPASTSRMQVIRLKNAVAEELSTTINQAIQAVISPPQQTTGQQGAGGFGNQQGAQELRDNKSVAVEFLASAGGIQQLIRSGILADVRVSFDARSNSLIVTAPEASMGLLEALVAELDQTPDAVSEIKVFSLKNADAQQSVDLLTTLFENTNQEDQLGVQLAGTEGSSSSLIPLRFSADIRTNTVLAIGSAESLSVVEAVLLRLDSDDTRQRSTSVIPLRNAPAEQVSVTLLDFLEQQQALQDSSEDLLSNIERLRQEVLVAPDVNSNSLIVSASPQYFNQIVQIIEQLDAQPPEVVIQALLVEVTLDATDEFGIELGFQDPLLLDRSLSTTTAGGTTTITAGPGLNFNNTASPLGGNYITGGTNPSTVATQGLSNFSLGRNNTALGFGGFVFSAQSDAVSVLLRALAARRTVQVLSRPQVRTTHNNEAYVTVGQQVPIVSGATQTTLGANPIINQQQVGITLRVTPRITPDGIIAMSVFADKSSLGSEADGVPVFVSGDSTIRSPVINQSQAVTVVNVPNGQTIVMGGMITKTDSTLERKVPWLGDLPIVGRAFRYDGTTTSRTELLIFLTPRIVLSDVDSELLKQVEAERLHFIESDAEQLHGPLYSVPGQDQSAWEPQEGTILAPEMPIRELLEPDTAVPEKPSEASAADPADAADAAEAEAKSAPAPETAPPPKAKRKKK
ncbi:MAG: putative ral secretion pathway protein [Planctomycetota bacterium]